jgi:hypothetical protein
MLKIFKLKNSNVASLLEILSSDKSKKLLENLNNLELRVFE